MISSLVRFLFFQLLFCTAFCASTSLVFSPANVSAEEDPKPSVPLKLHLIGGSKEYKSNESLASWQKRLEKRYLVKCTRSFVRDSAKHLPGIEKLKQADCLVIFCRRLEIEGEELALIKGHIKAGRPVIGIRTASHAFQNYLELDRDVFGGSYHGHGGGEAQVRVVISEKNAAHPILTGVKPWTRKGKLYRNEENAKDAKTLLTGRGAKETQPLAWIRTRGKQRVFYTSMGIPEDFKDKAFLRLMKNAVEWVCRRKLQPRGP